LGSSLKGYPLRATPRHPAASGQNVPLLPDKLAVPRVHSAETIDTRNACAL
jgi:hypothetical protein